MSVLTPDMFVKAVPGHDDIFAFTYGFEIEAEGKAESVVELDDGDLLIEGYASDFTGEDREGENFVDGAFQKGIKSFLAKQASLCYHHKTDHGIGTVLDLKEVEGKGLFMRARVDKQEPSSPLHYIYSGIKKGSYRGLSVGGYFKRKMTEAGRRIADVDLTEISVTPVPVHTGTGFSVVAGKALEGDVDKTEDEVHPEQIEFDLTGVKALVESLEGIASTRKPEEVKDEEPETKALPKSHDPQAATWLSELIGSTSRLRVASTAIKDLTDHDGLTELADDVESATARWESTGHKLAAKIGPLPPPPSPSF